MQMVTCGASGAAHIADYFALLHLLTRCDGDGGTVGIQCFHSTAMVYLNLVTIAAAPCGTIGNSHCAAGGCEDKRALRVRS